MKIFKKLVLFVLAALTLCAAASAYAKSGETGQVTADGVKLRQSPNTDAQVLYELPIGTQLEVLAKEDGWYRVLYMDGTVGYVRQDYLFVNSQGSRGAYVLDDGAMLRGGPSADSYVVAELHAGQGVKVKALVGEWYFTVTNDMSGYVHRSYLTLSSSTTAGVGMLKMGMEGGEVKKLQSELYRRGFLNKDGITGSYGAKTRAAVAEFQKACSLSSADGIAGTETLTSIYDSANKVEKANADFMRLKGSVVLLNWFKGGSEWLNKGARFTVVDVRTGLSFRARRFGGWYHADCEPITASDSAVIKKAAGGSWTWNRRPIWVVYDGKVVAASMHSMPHMSETITSNNFNGHFCIHLFGSKVHENSRECPRHQKCVQEAYYAGKK